MRAFLYYLFSICFPQNSVFCRIIQRFPLNSANYHEAVRVPPANLRKPERAGRGVNQTPLCMTLGPQPWCPTYCQKYLPAELQSFQLCAIHAEILHEIVHVPTSPERACLLCMASFKGNPLVRFRRHVSAMARWHIYPPIGKKDIEIFP